VIFKSYVKTKRDDARKDNNVRNEEKKNTKVVSCKVDLMAFHFLRRISHISPTPNMDESMAGKTAPSLSAMAR